MYRKNKNEKEIWDKGESLISDEDGNPAEIPENIKEMMSKGIINKEMIIRSCAIQAWRFGQKYDDLSAEQISAIHQGMILSYQANGFEVQY